MLDLSIKIEMRVSPLMTTPEEIKRELENFIRKQYCTKVTVEVKEKK